MKIKIQITVESDDDQLNVAQDVAHLDRGTLRPETLGLTLAEARSILLAETGVADPSWYRARYIDNP